MSANNNNTDPDTTESTRLRDRTQSAFQERREQAAAGSTRLRDRAPSAFQRQRTRVDRTQEAIAEQREQVAGALDLDTGSIRPVQLDDRGTDFGFVPTAAGRGELAEQFADDRPFVDAEDALVAADPTDGIETRTDPDRRDDIAANARAEVAGADEFTEPGDVTADVGPGGVTDVGLTDAGARRRAGRQFESETPLEDVAPTADVTRSADGFELDQAATRRAAARNFEDTLPEIEQGGLDPASDVTQAGEGFGLAEAPARDVASERIDEQLPDIDIGPGDIELSRGDDGSFDASFSTEGN